MSDIPFFRVDGATIALWLAIILVIWLVLREARTWYWKINDIVSLLQNINDNLIIVIENDIISGNIIEKKERNKSASSNNFDNDDTSESRIIEEPIIIAREESDNETEIYCSKNEFNDIQDRDIFNADEDIPNKTATQKIKDILNKKIF